MVNHFKVCNSREWKENVGIFAKRNVGILVNVRLRADARLHTRVRERISLGTVEEMVGCKQL